MPSLTKQAETLGTERRLALMVFTRIIIFLAFSCICYSANAQSVDCGKPPELPLKQQETEKLKGDLEGKAQLLSRLVGTGNLKGAIETERNTIWQSTSETTIAAW